MHCLTMLSLARRQVHWGVYDCMQELLSPPLLYTAEVDVRGEAHWLYGG